MAQTALNNLGINYGWNAGENGWKAGVDRNFLLTDALTQCNVVSRSTTAPPGSPSAGDRYLVPASGASGAWAGHANKIAIYDTVNTSWVLVAPLEGWRVYVADEDTQFEYSGSAWISGTRERVVTSSATSLTFDISHAGAYVRFTAATAVTATVPPNSSVAYLIGTTINIRQAGAGQVQLVAGAGVTLNTPETLYLRKQHSAVALLKVAADAWDVIGDLEVA